MNILDYEGNLSSAWYSKLISTGFIMNYFALAPKKYIQAVVIRLVYRIFRSCSKWKNVHDRLKKENIILRINQYPQDCFEAIIRDTLTNIVSKDLRNETKMKMLRNPSWCFSNIGQNASSPMRETSDDCALLMMWKLNSVKWCLPWENWKLCWCQRKNLLTNFWKADLCTKKNLSHDFFVI